jgi:hypothetical protein
MVARAKGGRQARTSSPRVVERGTEVLLHSDCMHAQQSRETKDHGKHNFVAVR